MRYIDYDEYTSIGGTLDETTFNQVIVAACALVDRFTFKRLRDVETISENVAACIRDLCDYIYLNNSASNRAVASKSQSAGGVSESESYVTKSNEDLRAEMYDIVLNYLCIETDDNGTPLMYKGVRQ